MITDTGSTNKTGKRRSRSSTKRAEAASAAEPAQEPPAQHREAEREAASGGRETSCEPPDFGRTIRHLRESRKHPLKQDAGALWAAIRTLAPPARRDQQRGESAVVEAFHSLAHTRSAFKACGPSRWGQGLGLRDGQQRSGAAHDIYPFDFWL